MYGAIPVGSFLGTIDNVQLTVASNATIAEGDLVNVQSGQAEVAAAGEVIHGVARAAATASTNVTLTATPFLKVVMDNDNVGTTFAAADAYSSLFDHTGGTGVMQVDTSTKDAVYDNQGNGTLYCVEYNPQGINATLDADTSIGLFVIKDNPLMSKE